jgi:hypothetical protein
VPNRRKKPRGTTTQPGYWAAKHALARFGRHVIDGRSRVAHALDEFRDALIADLGGAESVSQQQKVLVDLAVRTHLMVSSLDNYLLSLGSLVNKRKRAVWPVVRERVSLADSLARYMSMLGLEKREQDGGRLPESWIEKVMPREPDPPDEPQDAERETPQ